MQLRGFQCGHALLRGVPPLSVVSHLLNLLAAIALLVWGTQIVRTGILRVLGERLRGVLALGMGSRARAAASGLAVTSLIQSSTATCLILTSYLGRGLVPLAAGLAAMLGADVGTSLMAVLFSFDLSWLSPFLIFTGVVLHSTREGATAGRVGRVAIGLGLIMMSLHMIGAATRPLTEAPAMRALLQALPQEVLLDILVGAVLTVLSYSSLAIVLLTATLVASGLVPLAVGLGLVLGANLGSGVLALLATASAPVAERRLPLGNLLFKAAGCWLAIPLLPHLRPMLQGVLESHQQVVLFHLGFNAVMAALFIGFTGVLARSLQRWFVEPASHAAHVRSSHLDLSAQATPSLAISCAAREALHQADLVERMLRGVLPVMRDNDLALAEQLRQMDDQVDALYTDIKLYLTQVSRAALSEREGRRWADVMSFTINMEQIGDIIERVLQDLEDKKIRKARRFSDAGMAEIVHMHERLMANLRLGMSVFLDGHVRDARRLLEEKTRYRELQFEYAATHIARLQDNTVQSIETSSLHLDLISDLKRINSHICSIAYAVLESAGEPRQGAARASRHAPGDEAGPV